LTRSIDGSWCSLMAPSSVLAMSTLLPVLTASCANLHIDVDDQHQQSLEQIGNELPAHGTEAANISDLSCKTALHTPQ